MEDMRNHSSLVDPLPCTSFSSPSSPDYSPTSPYAEDLATKQIKSYVQYERDQDAVLGQLCFAPATQTTVVTTTTTTTTNFPPLVMKATKHLHKLDPKIYPLAASPTPSSIRKLRFKVGDRAAIFQEVDDARRALDELNHQHELLRASNGKIQTVSSFGRPPQTPRTQTPINTPGNSAHPGLLKETEANKYIKPRLLHRTRSQDPRVEEQDLRSLRSSRLRALQTSTPLTPSVDERKHVDIDPDNHGSNPVITPELETAEFAQILSPRPEHNNEARGSSRFAAGKDCSSTSSSSQQGTNVLHRRPSNPRVRLSTLNTTSAQDASLPSPSLSPVTAAANLQNRRGYFEDNVHFPQNHQDNLSQETLLPDDDPQHLTSSSLRQAARFSGLRQPSLTDLPFILDSFEAMPTEMKTYMMYQLLRRCPKSVLHFVAENVNPALKCDFLNLLPPELSQNIISYLDLKSLCRASQVSKKWRQVIDTDEKVWKDLFDVEGFELASTELQTAISEGWGWQYDPEPESYEQDISTIEVRSNSARPLSSSASIDLVNEALVSVDECTPSGQPRRTKRKVGQKTRTISRKQQKRKDYSPSHEIALFDTDSFKRHITSTDGPYATAEAAMLAVPMSNIGLPSLRTLHLHKSIYRRHHLISSNWMQDDIKPRHLAFKAHPRHVVTCLQFDAEKILTGSDDTNINVYDTQTGALRARLEGHEGGVWALQYVGSTLVSGSTDRSVRVWDIDKGICSHVFLGHTSTVRCLIILMPTEIGRTSSGRSIIMPKEPIIVTGSRDSTLRVWKLPKPGDPSYIQTVPPTEETESPYFVRALTGHGHSVRAIAAHGDTLVSGSYDCTVRVWKISTGETIHRLQGHNQKVYSVVLDHERNRCISGSMDNLVKVWSLENGNLLFNLEGHSSLVGLLDLQRNRLVSAAADSTLRIWDPDSGQCKNVLSAHTGAITCFQHDGRKVISGSDRNLKMWNVQTGEFVRDLLMDLSGVWQVKFDERRCVAAVQRNNLTYIEVGTLPQICVVISHCCRFLTSELHEMVFHLSNVEDAS